MNKDLITRCDNLIKNTAKNNIMYYEDIYKELDKNQKFKTTGQKKNACEYIQEKGVILKYRQVDKIDEINEVKEVKPIDFNISIKLSKRCDTLINTLAKNNVIYYEDLLRELKKNKEYNSAYQINNAYKYIESKGIKLAYIKDKVEEVEEPAEEPAVITISVDLTKRCDSLIKSCTNNKMYYEDIDKALSTNKKFSTEYQKQNAYKYIASKGIKITHKDININNDKLRNIDLKYKTKLIRLIDTAMKENQKIPDFEIEAEFPEVMVEQITQYLREIDLLETVLEDEEPTSKMIEAAEAEDEIIDDGVIDTYYNNNVEAEYENDSDNKEIFKSLDIDNRTNDFQEYENNIYKPEDSDEDEEKEESQEDYVSMDDSFRIYTNSLQKYPVLSPEEELELTTEYKRTGDKAIREKIINHNLKLVISAAKHYTNNNIGLGLMDLIQAGNMGLLTAVDKFDPEMGNKFSTYAMWWIKQSILRTISNESRLIRLPVHATEQGNKIKKAKRDLFSVLNREATNEELLKYINDNRLYANKDTKKLTADDLLLYTSFYDAGSITSLDLPIGEEGEDSVLGDFIPNHEQSPEDYAIQMAMNETLIDIIKKVLTDREIAVLSYRFGLNGFDRLTLNDVGTKYAVTRERIRQIEAKALMKLRRNPKLRAAAEQFLRK